MQFILKCKVHRCKFALEDGPAYHARNWPPSYLYLIVHSGHSPGSKEINKGIGDAGSTADQSVTYRYREFPVPGIFHFFCGIGTGIGTNWYRKKVSEPVSVKFGIDKKSRNRYRQNLVPEKVSEPV